MQRTSNSRQHSGILATSAWIHNLESRWRIWT